MRSLIFIFTVLLALPAVTHAEEASLLQVRDQASLDFERVTVEQNLKAKLLSVVQPMFPDARFNLEVVVNYKTRNEKKKKIGDGTNGDYVELGKYGIVAPTVADEVLHTDFVSHIGFIRITYISYSYLDENQLKILRDVTKKVVDIVPVWRLRIETVIPPAGASDTPAVTSAKPLMQRVGGQSSEFTMQWAWSFGFAALIFAIAFGFVFNFNRLREELRGVVEELRRSRSGRESKRESAYQTRPAQDFYTPHTDTAEKFAETEPIEVASQPHFEHHVEAEVHAVNVSPINQAFENLSRSAPDSEDQAFEALIREGRFETLREAASSYFPASLMLMLPPTILSAGLDLLGVHEKTGLILSMDPMNREILMRCLNAKAYEYVQHELQNFETDASLKAKVEKNGEQYWKEFVDIVRGLLRTNENLAAEAHPLLERWLDEKARGVRHAG